MYHTLLEMGGLEENMQLGIVIDFEESYFYKYGGLIYVTKPSPVIKSVLLVQD